MYLLFKWRNFRDESLKRQLRTKAYIESLTHQKYICKEMTGKRRQF